MDVEGGAADLWTGPVKVGTTTLAPPHYSNTAASLGGGTVGLAPFTLHGDDSDPPTGSSIPLANTPGPTNPIRIRHYGPITYDTDEVPVLIEVLIDDGTPYNRSSCLIPGAANVEIDSANDTILVVTPEIPLPNGFTYRIRPNVEEDAIDSLYCDIHSNDPVAAWVYEICVGDEHPADINLSGAVDTGDFSLLAGNMGNSGCFLPGDLDANGTVNTSDFNIMALHWGDGAGEDVIAACGTESLMGGGGGEGGMEEIEAALAEMGFESLDEFSAWLEELSEKEQLDVLLELIARLSE